MRRWQLLLERDLDVVGHLQLDLLHRLVRPPGSIRSYP